MNASTWTRLVTRSPATHTFSRRGFSQRGRAGRMTACLSFHPSTASFAEPLSLTRSFLFYFAYTVRPQMFLRLFDDLFLSHSSSRCPVSDRMPQELLLPGLLIVPFRATALWTSQSIESPCGRALPMLTRSLCGFIPLLNISHVVQ